MGRVAGALAILVFLVARKMNLKDYKVEFLKFAIENKVLTFGSFQLKSGRTSPYFFNAGLFNSGESLSKLGKFYAAALVDSGLQYDVLFGPAYKGIPLVTATSVALFTNHGLKSPLSFNRKEAKDHGEGGVLVGTPLTNSRVVIIDDVITAGTAIRESVTLINKQEGASLEGVLIALDRMERGVGEGVTISAIQQVEQDMSVKVVSIVSLRDLVVYLTSVGGMDKEVETIVNYWKEFGVGSLV